MDIITRHLYLVPRQRSCLSSSSMPKRWWQSSSQGGGQRRGHWSTSPTPTAGLPGRKLSYRAWRDHWRPGATSKLGVSPNALLCTCLTLYPDRGRVPLPQKGSAWSQELPSPSKLPVINYAAAPLCRGLSARWVRSQSFVSGSACSSDPRLCTEVRRGAPLGQVRACSKSQQSFLSWVSGSALPFLTNLSERGSRVLGTLTVSPFSCEQGWKCLRAVKE